VTGWDLLACVRVREPRASSITWCNRGVTDYRPAVLEERGRAAEDTGQIRYVARQQWLAAGDDRDQVPVGHAGVGGDLA
jgi:hypothetical protein